MKKNKLSKRINVVKLLQLIIKIISLCIETFREDEIESDENEDLTDEKIADYVFTLATYSTMLGDLCRQECESDPAFLKRYTEQVEKFMSAHNMSVPIVNPDGTQVSEQTT